MENTTQQPEVMETAPTQVAENTQESKKETTQVPTSLIRWLVYSVLFFFMLTSFWIHGTIPVGQAVSIAIILGHFSGQLNKLIDK